VRQFYQWRSLVPSVLLGLSCPRPSGRCASFTDQNCSRQFCQPLCHKQ